jgi:hypothetical protein
MKQIRLITGITIALAGLCGCTHMHNGAGQMHSSISASTAAEEQWGIEVQQISLSAEGYMLDFRYLVTEPQLAKQVTTRQAQCYVIDQKSGTRMLVPTPPKVGSLRQKTPEPVEGKIYYIMFANPGRRVRHGDKVTVVIDDLEIPELIVQ